MHKYVWIVRVKQTFYVIIDWLFNHYKNKNKISLIDRCVNHKLEMLIYVKQKILKYDIYYKEIYFIYKYKVSIMI